MDLPRWRKDGGHGGGDRDAIRGENSPTEVLSLCTVLLFNFNLPPYLPSPITSYTLRPIAPGITLLPRSQFIPILAALIQPEEHILIKKKQKTNTVLVSVSHDVL